MEENRIYIVQFAEEKVTAAVIDNNEAILPEDSTLYSNSGKRHIMSATRSGTGTLEVEHRINVRNFLGLLELTNQIRNCEKDGGNTISEDDFGGTIVMAREESLTGNVFFTRDEALANSMLLAYQYGKVFARRAIERVPISKLHEAPAAALEGVIQPAHEIYNIPDKQYTLWMAFDKGMNEGLEEFKFKLRNAVLTTLKMR